MSEQHKVEIKAISKKTRGIKVKKEQKEVWLNLDENIDINKIKKGIAVIEVDVIDGRPYVLNIEYPQEQKQEQQKQEEDDIKWLKKDRRISRLALLNTSIEIYKLYGGEIDFSSATDKGRKEKILKEILSIARELEKWVWEDF